MEHKALTEAITAYLGKNGFEPEGGVFFADFPAAYDDTLMPGTVAGFLEAVEPDDAFREFIDDTYVGAFAQAKYDLAVAAVSAIGGDQDLSEEDEEYIEEYIGDYVFYRPDEDHFLKQMYKVDIMLDTGDADSEFAVNAIYPCPNAEKGDPISPNSAVAWLAKQQGYSTIRLWKELQKDSEGEPNGFLESMRTELANLPNFCGIMTFLVSMSLDQILTLQDLLNEHAKNPESNHSEIILGKETMCGLFQPWDGGGSLLEVQLEQDVRIPVGCIWRAVVDDTRSMREHYLYSVDDVYGLVGSAWKESVKKLT